MDPNNSNIICVGTGKNDIQITLNNFLIVKILKNNKININLRPQLSITAGKQTIEFSRILNIDGTLQLSFYHEDVFNLVYKQLSIPIQLNLSYFDFEIGYNFNFTNALGSEVD